MAKHIGKSTVRLEHCPYIIGNAAVGGKEEGKGPIAADFDHLYTDDALGEASFEKAESRLQKDAILHALQKAEKTPEEMDFVLSGDLLAQCIGSAFGVRELGIPFLGLYGACSTMALALGLAAVLTDAGAARQCVAATSSHFAAAERQFRQPLEYGGQRPPTAQRTATAAGATVLSATPPTAYHSPYIVRVQAVTFGKIVDLGIKDANNMGAAMAPAAADTIAAALQDNGQPPSAFDAVFTGDLGAVGRDLLLQLLQQDFSVDLHTVHQDCGLLLYDRKGQDVHAGASGCGCAASVLNAYILPKMQSGEWSHILLAATGALLSTTSSLQGESIPAVAHAVRLTAEPYKYAADG